MTPASVKGSDAVAELALQKALFSCSLAELGGDLNDFLDIRGYGDSPHREINKLVRFRRDLWLRAFSEDSSGVSASDICQYGLLLGRMLEMASLFHDAEEIFEFMADDRFLCRLDTLEAQSVCISAGEVRRRRGNLQGAEIHFQHALDVPDTVVRAGNEHQLFFRERGRALYEIAYLNRLRGDVGASRSAYQQSEAECALGEDDVGVEIARCSIASLHCEEGLWGVALTQLELSLQRFSELAEDPGIRAVNRTGLALRWLANARGDACRALLGIPALERAQALIEQALSEEASGASVRGLSIAKRLEARLHLAKNDLDAAASVIDVSFRLIEPRSLQTTELAAATMAMHGLIRASMGQLSLAKQSLGQACDLPSDLNNRRAQGLAWAARAILARGTGDRALAISSVRRGLELLTRCGSPIRLFLLRFLSDVYSGSDMVMLSDLQNVAWRFGCDW
jgi:tetratricopeptide (TPR) repeat protein